MDETTNTTVETEEIQETEKGLADVKSGNLISADDAENYMRQKYGI